MLSVTFVHATKFHITLERTMRHHPPAISCKEELAFWCTLQAQEDVYPQPRTVWEGSLRSLSGGWEHSQIHRGAQECPSGGHWHRGPSSFSSRLSQAGLVEMESRWVSHQENGGKIQFLVKPRGWNSLSSAKEDAKEDWQERKEISHFLVPI